MRRLAIIMLLSGLAFGLSGCLVVSALSTAIDTVDQKFSRNTGEECSTLHLALGEDYCRPRFVEVERPPLYCFKTLGGVDCHATADPYARAEAGETPVLPLADPNRTASK